MPDINLSPYTAEYEAIQQRRKLAELLSQQGSEPIQMPTQAGVRISPLQGLAKMFEVYSGQKGIEKAQQESKALAQRQSSESMQDYSKLMEAIKAPAIAGSPERTPQLDVQETQQMADQNTPMPPNIPAITKREAGELTPEGFASMKTPTGQQQYMAQFLAQAVPKEGTVLPEGASYITKAGKVLIQGTGKEDYHVPKNEFDPLTGQTLTVAYSNKGNRKIIDTKGAYTPDQWNSIPVAERAKMAFDQYKFGNVSATDLMQAAQRNVSLGQELAKLGFDIGPSAAGGAVRLPVNAPMPNIPTNGIQPNTRANAPVVASATTVTPSVAPNAAQRPYTPFNAVPLRGNAPIAPSTNVLPAQQGNVRLSPRAMQEVEKARLLEEFKGMNESQSNAALFGGAMSQAQSVIQGIEKRGTTKNAIGPSVLQAVVKLVPFGVGEQSANIIESISRNDPTSLFGPNEDQQRLGQAQIAFATAWLRKTSGASFGGSEIANTIKEYFPLIGESDAVVKQKAEARERAIEGLKIATGLQGKTYIDKYGASKNTLDPLGLRPRGGQ